jgi:hypothetical protein
MTAQVGDVSIEKRLQWLVEALGDLPGINTVSFGRGNSESNHRRGRLADGFHVDFNVDVLAGGWRSLSILVFAITQTDSFENLSVSAWRTLDEPTDCLSFKIRGTKSADPDDLGNAIERVLEGDYSGFDEPNRQLGG